MKRVEQVSKAGGINPFCVTRQVVSMRALVKALDLITLAGTEEQTAAHGLRAVVRRSNALITNTRRSSQAEEAKETIQPFLVAVDLAQIVIRRRRGLRVSNKLYQDALQLVEDTAKACSLEISRAMEENESPAWPRVEITRKLDKIALSVSAMILSGLP